jgi:hypothetical protein
VLAIYDGSQNNFESYGEENFVSARDY